MAAAVPRNVGINGVSTGISRPGEFNFFNFASFAINGGFRDGLNTLDFIAFNQSGPFPDPTGLRVELSGTATPQATTVPEPGSLALLGCSILSLLGCARRR